MQTFIAGLPDCLYASGNGHFLCLAAVKFCVAVNKEKARTRQKNCAAARRSCCNLALENYQVPSKFCSVLLDKHMF